MTTASFVEASSEGSWTACGSRSGFVAILVSFLSLSTRPVRYRRDLASIAHPIGVVRQERGPLSGPESGRLRSQSCSLASPPCDNGSAWCPPALDPRLAVRYQIGGMSPADTTDYIRHHCKFAGRSDTLFSDDAIG